MKFLNILSLCIGLIFSTNCYTQKYQKGCTQIYVHSYELNNIPCDTSIKKIVFNDFSRKIILKYKTHKKNIISIDSVWGYRNNKNFPQRVYKKKAYTLYEYCTSIYIYFTSGSRMHTHYFFSDTLDGAIFFFTKKQLQKQLNSKSVEKILSDIELKRILQ